VRLGADIELAGQAGARGTPVTLDAGRQVVLFAPVSAGDLLPAGTLLDDWIGPEQRAAIDASAAAHLSSWSERRSEIDAFLGLPLLAMWEMELLADVFMTTVRIVEGVLHATETQGVRSVSLRGVTPDLSDCLEAMLGQRGVTVRRSEAGTAPAPLLVASARRGGLPSRVIAVTGLPARARGPLVVWPYWHLEGVIGELMADRALAPVFDLLNMPGTPDRRRVALNVARNGWWARPGARARHRSRRRVAAAVAAARRSPVADGPLDRLLDSRSLELLDRRAGDSPADYEAAAKTLRSGDVRCCVLPFDSPPEARALAEAARARAIPVVVVQHGGVHPEELQSDRTFADLVAVWSQDDARRIAARARGTLVLTGNPGAPHRIPVRARGSAHTVVLVESVTRLSTRVDARMPLRHLDAALEALEEARPGTRVTVRAHPSERALDAIRRVIARHPSLRTGLSKGGPIEPLLCEADLCIGAVSTATLQAGALHTPVIMLDVGSGGAPWPLDGTTAVPYVETAAALAAAIPDVLSDPSAEPAGAAELAEALGQRPPGVAVDAVLELIRGAIDSSGGGPAVCAAPARGCVNLRPARVSDAEHLFAWRNDPQTRRFAFRSEALVWADHLAWLERRLADPDTAILVAEEGNVAVGQIRFDRQADVAAIHIVIAPDARGRGIGASLLRLAASACPFPVERLRAEVVPANAASLAAFAKAGFDEVARDARAVTLELPGR